MDALILAGGKSSRMNGNHKGSLKMGEETFTQILIKEMEKAAENVWLSYGASVHETYDNCKVVKDIYQECGPMGGLHAGLCATGEESLFVVACDMPFMQAALVNELKKHLTEDVSVVVPVSNGRIHPLAAIYKKSVLPVITKLLEDGNYRLRSIFEHTKVSYVEIENENLQKMLQNINTMEEFQEILVGQF